MKKPTHYSMRKLVTDPGNGIERTDNTRVAACAVDSYLAKGYELIGPSNQAGAHVKEQP